MSALKVRFTVTLVVVALVAGVGIAHIASATPASFAPYTPSLSAGATTQKFSIQPSGPAALSRQATKLVDTRLGARPLSAARQASPELLTARSLLAEQIRKHPILKGATVEFGDARGYQAICYYQSARIVISTTHTASLQRIIEHEVWHIIDWRDNGRIDWGESVPPR